MKACLFNISLIKPIYILELSKSCVDTIRKILFTLTYNSHIDSSFVVIRARSVYFKFPPKLLHSFSHNYLYIYVNPPLPSTAKG